MGSVEIKIAATNGDGTVPLEVPFHRFSRLKKLCVFLLASLKLSSSGQGAEFTRGVPRYCSESECFTADGPFDSSPAQVTNMGPPMADAFRAQRNGARR